METQQLQLVAGIVSSLIFVSSNLAMLLKAFKTKDLKSYSLGMIVLYNVGNVVYWLYVASLPFGPIWFLHGFYTVTLALMLVWYLCYEKGWQTSSISHVAVLWGKREESAHQAYLLCLKWRCSTGCQCGCQTVQCKPTKINKGRQCLCTWSRTRRVLP